MTNSTYSPRAFRPVSPESVQELGPLKEFRDEFSGPGIERMLDPSLTLIGATEANSLEKTAMRQFFIPLGSVFDPLPESAQLPITLEIESVEFMSGQRKSDTKALTAILKDPQEILLQERLEYFDRMRRPVPERPFIPHVTLFRIANNRIIEEMRRWTEARTPSLLSLEALRNTKHLADRRPRSKSAHKKVERTIIPLAPNKPIPTVSQVTIPKDAFAMLTAARRAQIEEQ